MSEGAARGDTEPLTQFGVFAQTMPETMRAFSPKVRLAHRFALAADRTYMTTETCVMYLARRVGEAKRAKERAGTLFGRLYNSMTGVSAEVVSMSGPVLARSMSYIEDKFASEVDMDKDYEFPLETAVTLLSMMKTKAKAEGLIK